MRSYIEGGNRGPEWSCPICQTIVNAKTEGSTCKNCGGKCSAAFFAALTSPFDPLHKARPRDEETPPTEMVEGEKRKGASRSIQESSEEAFGKPIGDGSEYYKVNGKANSSYEDAPTTAHEVKAKMSRKDSEDSDFLDSVLSTKEIAKDLDMALTQSAGQFQQAFQAEIREQDKQLKNEKQTRRKERKRALKKSCKCDSLHKNPLLKMAPTFSASTVPALKLPPHLQRVLAISERALKKN